MIDDWHHRFERSYTWFVDGSSISAVMTLGEVPDRMITALFEAGYYTEALELDQKAVQVLFNLEKQVRAEIESWCRQNGKRISKCLTDPDDLPAVLMRKAVETAQRGKDVGVKTNESGMLIPGKSLCEVFLLNNGIAEVQKSPCSACERLDCSYRCQTGDAGN